MKNSFIDLDLLLRKGWWYVDMEVRF